MSKIIAARLLSLETAFAILSLLFLVPQSAKAVEPTSVKGTIGAQSVELAYDSLLAGLKQQPEDPPNPFIDVNRSVDADGLITVRAKMINGGFYNGNAYGFQCVGALTKTGDIDVTAETLRSNLIGGPPKEETKKQSFHRSSSGMLIYHTEGNSRFGEKLELTLTVTKDHVVSSSLTGEQTLIALSDIGPPPILPGGASANQHLLNFIPDQSSSAVLKPMTLVSHDSLNTQAIKSAYNNLLVAIQSRAPGEVKEDLTFRSLSKSATITSSIDSKGNKVVRTSQLSNNDEFTTIETLHANGNIEIQFTSTGRLGSQTERYERLAQNGLSYSLEFGSARGSSHNRQITVKPDGQSVCVPEKSWGIPSTLSGDAPGQKTATINWRRVGPHSGSLSLSD